MLKRRYWTEPEAEFLKENWLKLSIYDLSEKLDRTVSAIQAYATKHKLPTRPAINAIPKEHVSYVVEFAGIIPLDEMAEHLGYSKEKVYSIGYRNGVKFSKSKLSC